ncbi:MAG: hypothetical protein Q9197_004085 [Variospora fuerteventurae]
MVVAVAEVEPLGFLSVLSVPSYHPLTRSLEGIPSRCRERLELQSGGSTTSTNHLGQKNMTNLPSISLRKHYRKVPGEPEEPTSTIVLTSAYRFVVDSRVLKHLSSITDLDSGSQSYRSNSVQWAFAGTSESVCDSNGKCFFTWHHWIDSQTDDPAHDRGEMITQDDGDVLEKGTMLNPETGMEDSYEELWTDLPLTPGSSSGPARTCVVLRVEDVETGMRGMVVRVGRWCQGILKKDGAVSLERWQWVEGKENSPDGQWDVTVRVGADELPCAHILDVEKSVEGTKIHCGAFSWDVVEVSKW